MRAISLKCLSLLVVVLMSTARAASYKAEVLRADGYQVLVYALGASGSNYVGMGITVGEYHALSWNMFGEDLVDLHPPGFSYTEGSGTSGSIQVGRGYGAATSGQVHALLWKGTAESYVDLHPSGFQESWALGASGDQQVGYGIDPISGNHNALLWQGAAESVVNLNPAGHRWSHATGTTGTNQVGFATDDDPAAPYHAMLWAGTADSAVDLHPVGYESSAAISAAGASQVGYGVLPTGHAHALLWQGSSENVVDLAPPGYNVSHAVAVSGDLQVGFGWGPATGGEYVARALMWRGSAASVVDLHEILADEDPSFLRSEARGIDSSGNIVGFGIDSNYQTHPVKWTLVPEPLADSIATAGVSVLWMGRFLGRRSLRAA